MNLWPPVDQGVGEPIEKFLASVGDVFVAHRGHDSNMSSSVQIDDDRRFPRTYPTPSRTGSQPSAPTR
jgi:hypothetical protein